MMMHSLIFFISGVGECVFVGGCPTAGPESCGMGQSSRVAVSVNLWPS